MTEDLALHWPLDPAVTFLNHGSFGACPTPVVRYQNDLRLRLESEPVRFFTHEYEPLLDASRRALAGFVGAAPEDLVFVTNATTGVNTVVRSLRFQPGDELLITDHAYRACRNALDFAAERAGARVVVAEVPFPVGSSEEILNAVLAAVTPRTKLALIDHITSPTGILFPVEGLVRDLASRGIDTLVDGAHAPGMIPLNVEALGAAYYTGNCHKWLCGPKGAGFLWVRKDRQEAIRPLVISHGATAQRPDRPRLHLEFDWQGTADPTAYLSVGEALRFMGSLLPGRWPDLMARNHALALDARKLLCETLKVPAPAPESLLGSLATIPLGNSAEDPDPFSGALPLQKKLLERHAIEVPVFFWPEKPRRFIRISAQIYNRPEQYARLAEALALELG